ncbi:MAG TPA: hypothetical protein VMW45_00705 [Dehalococcoidia bacterium]|nr:hypothetical protein [Dehalococcoidia bacterium]
MADGYSKAMGRFSYGTPTGTMGRFTYQPYQPAVGASASTSGSASWQPSWLDTQLGSYGAMEAGLLDQKKAIHAQIDDLKSILGTFTSAGDVFTRWMIGNSISQLEEQNYKLTQGLQTYYAAGEQAKIISETAQPGWVSKEKLDEWKENWGRMEEVKETAEQDASGSKTEAPIPDWMQPYIESSMQYTKGGAGQLKPIGAQAELGTEQLGKMTGYLGWGKAGAPKYFSKDYVNKLQNLPSWYAELSKISEKLTPVSNKKQAKWRPTFQ